MPAKTVPGRNALRNISGRKAGEDRARSQCPLRGDEIPYRIPEQERFRAGFMG